MSLFFTSDSHYFHTNIIRYSNRPFDSVEAMNSALILRWNSVVKPGDEVWHLGDLGFCSEILLDQILRQLKGQKFLIFGNHDKAFRKSPVIRKYFAWSGDYHELNYKFPDRKQKIVLSHYPFERWNNSHHGSWNLHGHCHGTLPQKYKRMDVGVDCWNYTPVSILQLEEFFQDKENPSVEERFPFNAPTDPALDVGIWI